jgi:DNA-binding transcriptional ArsR family regulator
MATTLHLGPEDLLEVRFAVSPLFETISALRVLGGHADESGWHAIWRTALEPDAAAGLEALLALHKPAGYVPDFISPPPRTRSPRVAEQLREVRRTPLGQVRDELAGALRDQRDAAAGRLLRELIADPARARALLARQLELAWQRLIARHWPRLLALFEADIAHRSDVLAVGGLRGALAGLHPSVNATSSSVRLEDGSRDTQRELGGEGLVLMPSAFIWPTPVVVLDLPWQPSLIYPVRGVAELWRPAPRFPPGALGRLLGETRARILGMLDEPASTTSIARGLGLSPANVSVHLAVLHDAGLAVAARRGREVRYARTDLGSAIVARSIAPAEGAHTNLTCCSSHAHMGQ